MPATFTEALTASKSSKHRTVRWTPCDSGTCLCTGKLVIDTDRERVTYGLVELPTTWDGRAVKLFKVGGVESYDVFASEDGTADRCDCRGFLRHGHCKHTDGLRALVINNWLADPRCNPDADTGPTETNEQNDELPACFKGIGPSPVGCPF